MRSQTYFQTYFGWNGDATNVFIITSLDWTKKIKLFRKEYDLFEIVIPLRFGTYEYKFIVDEEYCYDDNKPMIKNYYGNFNNIIFVFRDYMVLPTDKKNIETYNEFIDYAFEKTYEHIIEQFKICIKSDKKMKEFCCFERKCNNKNDFNEILQGYVITANFEEYITDNVLNTCEIYFNNIELIKLIEDSISYGGSTPCSVWAVEQGIEDLDYKYCNKKMSFKGIISIHTRTHTHTLKGRPVISYNQPRIISYDYLYYNKNNIYIKDEDQILNDCNLTAFITYSKQFVNNISNKLDDKIIMSFIN